MNDSSQVGEARRFAALLANLAGLDETRAGRVGIVINELGNNLLKYAKDGRLLLRWSELGDTRGVEMISLDAGPGFNDAERLLTDGVTSGATPGTGLGAVRRLSDVFDLYSLPTKGTAILSVIAAAEPLPSRYKIGIVSVPHRGESVCGDACAWSLRDESLSALVVDGLGHGPHAHQAAQEAVAVFDSRGTETLETLLKNMHGRMKGTRGGAVFLLETQNARDVAFTGVGNIRAFVQTAEKTKTLISQNGTAGVQIRTTRMMSQAWNGDGALILHSDGLSTRAETSAFPGLLAKHPAIIAAVLYREFDRGTDDSTIFVIGRNP